MKIKICGITNYNDAKLCIDLGADAIGYIFYEKSKRYIEPKTVKEINNGLPAFVIKIGVFVNANVKEINKISKEAKLNVVQLHGDENQSIISQVDLPVIKAFRIDNDFNFDLLNKYENCSYLLDSFHVKEFGGTGLKFNWNKIPREIKNKIILAGGISIDNLENIFNKISPYAIDVSSSLENKPGEKSHDKLNKFFKKYNELRK